MVTSFRGRPLPEPADLAGYAAVIAQLDLPLPLPPRLTAIGQRYHPTSTDDWRLLEPRRAPGRTLSEQLEFALKWEGIDLAVLSATFKVAPQAEITTAIRAKPTGAYTRRLWFIYEWLTGKRLDIDDLGKVRAVPVLDPKKQFVLEHGTPSPRHRVIDNLPGTREFCPLVRQTPAMKRYADSRFEQLARKVVARTRPDVVARAAAFLLLSDSKASFMIEGEQPSPQRASRWAQAIKEAGNTALSISELGRLQAIVLGKTHFVRPGLRREGGFVGVHDRDRLEPLPEHISARPEDLADLVSGMVSFVERSREGRLDPVVAAASVAFGFVYVHPFEDGNGRIHRWLIHHVLAEAGYNPPGIVFPISAAMLRDIAAYRAVLESYSKPLLPLIDWRPTPRGNVEVLNNTGDYYRFFDATAHASYLYGCVEQTLERDLPDEVAFLQAYDQFAQAVKAITEMPDRTISLLHRFLAQGEGKLSRRARRREFAALTDDQGRRIEQHYDECFNALKDRAQRGE